MSSAFFEATDSFGGQNFLSTHTHKGIHLAFQILAKVLFLEIFLTVMDHQLLLKAFLSICGIQGLISGRLL